MPNIDIITPTLSRDFARELANALEHEVETAPEFHSTEQFFDKAATILNTELNE